jgi:hypothetical protein
MRPGICALASLLATLGCGVQLTTGIARTGIGKAPAATLNGSATVQALRHSNSVVAARIGTVPDHGVTIKSLMLHGGYDWLIDPSTVGIEPGIDLGAGQPPTHFFAGNGAYGGVSTTVHSRLTGGTGDHIPSFNVVFPMLELVVIQRTGVWVPPERSNTTKPFVEVGIELGLRFAVGSDVATTGQGHVWDGGAPRPETPGGPPPRGVP